MIKRISLTAAAVLMAGVLAGCSSPSADPSGGSDGGGSDARIDAAFEALPASIRDSGTLTAGGSFDYPPYLYRDDDGKESGFDYDLVNALGERMGVEVKWESMAFASLIPSVQNGRVDLATDGLGIINERLDATSMFHIASQEIAWLVAAGNPTDFDANDMCGHTLGTAPEGAQVFIIEAANAECVANGKEPVETVLLDAVAGPVAAQSGQIDAWSVSIAVGNFRAGQDNGFDTSDVTKGWETPNGLVLGKTDDATQLADAMSIALESMIDDGSLAKLAEKHGLGEGIPAKATFVTSPEELAELQAGLDASGWISLGE